MCMAELPNYSCEEQLLKAQTLDDSPVRGATEPSPDN